MANRGRSRLVFVTQQGGESVPDAPTEPEFVTGARLFDALIDEARASLTARNVAPALLGVRRVGRWRGARIVRQGTAWHVGVLLVADDAVYATGDVIRAVDGSRRGYTADASRERAERGYEAFRGGFAVGDTVHVGWTTIDRSVLAAAGASGPVAILQGIPHVRWSPAGAPMPLADYLAERIDLLSGPAAP